MSLHLAANRTRRTVARLALPALAALSVSCSKCGDKPGVAPTAANPAQVLPRDCALAVEAPHLGQLTGHALQLTQLKLVTLGASLAGMQDAAFVVAELKRQLGFDPFTAAGLQAAGLDPAGALLGAQLADGTVLALVPLSDPSKLDATLAKLAKDRLGAPKRDVDGEGHVQFRGSVASMPAPVVYQVRGTSALLGLGPHALEAVRAAEKRTAAEGLGDDVAWTALHARDASADLRVYVPTGSKLAGKAGVTQAVTATLAFREHVLDVSGDVRLDTLQATALAGLKAGVGQESVAALDPDSFLVARAGLDPATLWPIAEELVPRSFRQRLLDAGIIPSQILANLQPGVVLGLTLPSKLDLSHPPSFDPRETNPFRYVFLEALGHVKDQAAAAKTMADVTKFGPRIGAVLEEAAVGPARAWTFKYELGEGARIALEADTVAVSGGEGRLPLLLDRARTMGASAGATGSSATDGGGARPTGPTLPGPLQTRFAQAGAAAYLDLGKLVERLNALPASAYGLGGFAYKAAATTWLNAIGELPRVYADASLEVGQPSRLTYDVQLAIP